MTNVNNIYADLKGIADNTKSKKLSSEEVNSKYLKFVDEGTREQVIAKLDKNGYITRTSKCDSNFLREAKSDYDLNFLKDIQAKGSYTYKPSNESYCDKICNDPTNKDSSKLFVEGDNKVNGKYEIYNPTLNNGNETHRRNTLASRKLIAENKEA